MPFQHADCRSVFTGPTAAAVAGFQERSSYLVWLGRRWPLWHVLRDFTTRQHVQQRGSTEWGRSCRYQSPTGCRVECRRASLEYYRFTWFLRAIYRLFIVN
ncbi:uncharacterized protein LOC126749231 [Anthonomus grandis grandis]|uniref:uncharacterized protein LOC126749231 n=1 Tax=Anthonomus grandis grandis TaxID=2921223 RepID=UPI0021654986|nr:uncharacterized protein LOC126749231 [Anthonomus grandis grandis]